MKIIKVYRKINGGWQWYKKYQSKDGYDVFVNQNLLGITKNGYVVFQGNMYNFYYEVEYEEDNS